MPSRPITPASMRLSPELIATTEISPSSGNTIWVIGSFGHSRTSLAL
jgi:hypothetical protein